MLLMLASWSAAVTPAPQQPMLTMPGDNGLRYAIAVPEAYDGSTAVPLVLALHFGWGGGSPPPDYSATFLRVLVEPALRDLGAIIVAPLSPGGAWTDPTDAMIEARDVVWAVLDRMGGIGSPSVEAAWIVVGQERTIKEFCQIMRFAKDRPLNQMVACGLVNGALSVMVSHFGIIRRG